MRRWRGSPSGQVLEPSHLLRITESFRLAECAQVDWGTFGSVAVGNTRRRLSFFVMVLAFSRQMFVEFTVSQTMEHFLACHQHAFTAFGRLPARIMVDNLKSAVLRRLVGCAPVFNPRYLDFARHYGFAIEACNVGRATRRGASNPVWVTSKRTSCAASS
jgi:transposase